MTTDTEVKPLTAVQASEAARIVADYAAERGGQSVMDIADALLLIHNRRHTVIDTAELERLRADAQRLDALEKLANQPGGVLLHDGSETGRTGLGLRPGRLVRSLRDAIDAAQQEQSNDR